MNTGSFLGHGKEQVQSQTLRSLNVNILAEGKGRWVVVFLFFLISVAAAEYA
jgi:hypothetical protein